MSELPSTAISEFYKEYSKYTELCDHKTELSKELFTKLMTGVATEEEYTKFRNELYHVAELHDLKHSNLNLMGFSPTGIGMPRLGRNMVKQAVGLSTGILPVDDVLETIKGAAIEAGTEAVGKTAAKVAEQVKRAAERLGNQNEQTSNGGGSSVKATGFGSNGNEDIMSIISMPLNIDYKSGVVSTLYPPNQNVPTRDWSSFSNSDGRLRSADLACVIQRVPPGNAFSDVYWKQTLIPNLQLKAQASVGFNINADFNFSYTKVVAYFNLLMGALGKYFFMVNTYSVIQGTGQNDVSRNVLRRMFQTSDLQYLALLRERLNALPIPPKMIERSSFLYSTYKSNPDSNCSNNIGFIPVPMTSSSNNYYFDTINMDLLSTIENLGILLDNPNHSLFKTVDMMARVFPNWVSTTVGATQEVPQYSHEFMNIFINSPCDQSSYLASSATDFKLPSVVNDTDTVQFAVSGEFKREELGDQQAACSIYSASDQTWSGVLVPSASTFQLSGNTIRTNRYTFAYSSTFANGEPNWVTSNVTVNATNGYGPLGLSQPYANTVVGSDSHHAPPFGTYSVMGNTVRSMSQPSIDWMAEMFDIGSLTQRDSGSNRRGGGRRNNNRYRRNRSGNDIPPAEM
uniref:Uncharacterized protein n=1 Tax=viral metagenome TaxID=1070528 RepID=A0A2V0RJ22_9ZZZZ